MDPVNEGKKAKSILLSAGLSAKLRETILDLSKEFKDVLLGRTLKCPE